MSNDKDKTTAEEAKEKRRQRRIDGRIVRKRISLNEELHDIEGPGHRCPHCDGPIKGGFAADTTRLLFTWLISHLDVEGRTHGSPGKVRAMVFPLMDWLTTNDVRQMLQELDEKQLIQLYEVDGKNYLAFPKFPDNQPNLRKDREQPSTIPPPPELRSNSGVTPTLLRTNPQYSGPPRTQKEQTMSELNNLLNSGVNPEQVRSNSALSRAEGNVIEGNRTELNRIELNSGPVNSGVTPPLVAFQPTADSGENHTEAKSAHNPDDHNPDREPGTTHQSSDTFGQLESDIAELAAELDPEYPNAKIPELPKPRPKPNGAIPPPNGQHISELMSPEEVQAELAAAGLNIAFKPMPGTPRGNPTPDVIPTAPAPITADAPLTSAHPFRAFGLNPALAKDKELQDYQVRGMIFLTELYNSGIPTTILDAGDRLIDYCKAQHIHYPPGLLLKVKQLKGQA